MPSFQPLKNFFSKFRRRQIQTVETIEQDFILEKPVLSKVLEEKYQIVQDDETIRYLFLRLRNKIFDELEQMEWIRRQQGSGPFYFREYGKVAGERDYFYLKYPGEKGWLFERTETGWIISRSEKIIDRELFLRQELAWDHVLIQRRMDGNKLVRIESHQMGKSFVTYLEYEWRILQELGLAPELN